MLALTSYGVVIVGAGHAAGEIATALRHEGYEAPIAMIGHEPWLPYQRPPLSKTLLSGHIAPEALCLKPHATYEKARVDVALDTEVLRIDRSTKEITLSDGRKIGYASLVLATGGRARKLSTPQSSRLEGCENFHYLRTIADGARIRERFEPEARLVVIGGGYIGLEVAAVGIKCGLKVTVLEALPRVLARVTAPEISTFYERIHREAGVNLLTGVRITGFEIDPSGDCVRAVLTDQASIAADLVIVGVGLQPNIELALEAGLEVSDGIVVNEFMRTCDPSILAIGDCANHPNVSAGCRLRLESVPNAVEQAHVAAAALVGKPRPYNSLPWFWSDQYDLKLQMAGISWNYDQLVLRGDTSGRSFMAFYMRAQRIVAVDSISRAGDFMFAKRLIAAGRKIDPAMLADPALPLKSLLET